MAYIPHSPADIEQMLDVIGVNSLSQLFDEIPKNLQVDGLKPEKVPAAINEMQAKRIFSELATQDHIDLNFIGAGAYEHHIPAAVWDIVGRGEFMTAYTPYQAEASQGTLQVIYEYQTMMASLMGMEVSNASMYEGATALAEAILMAVRLNRKSKTRKILVPYNLHPNFRKTLNTVVKNQQIEIIELPFCSKTGKTLLDSLKSYEDQDITAIVISQPNFFGTLEEVDELTNWGHKHDAIVIASVNPMAMALLKEPGSWGEKGVDIACGTGQPFGVPLASGGPYLGFMCCKQEHVRQMPGRIVGRTVDKEGKAGFTLTLQAREQHIRRSKATSNICTNQGLLMTAATIYMSLMGPDGIKQVAMTSHQRTKKLAEKISEIDEIEVVFAKPFFHEIVVKLPIDAHSVLQFMANRGIQAGFALENDYPELKNCILVCATETKNDDDLIHYQATLDEAIQTLKGLNTSNKDNVVFA